MRIQKITSVASVLILLTAIGATALPQAAHADLDVSLNFDLFGDDAAQPVAIAPPPLPVYVVPAPPMEGYIWTPGHWRWNGYGYFWVPGTWVQPPVVGVLWTPGYWGWNDGIFAWHEGYWGRHVGYYGGINYGGGYGGEGFAGGGWNGGHYRPNPAVVNVVNVTNVTNVAYNHASFAGGPGGTTARPTAEEDAAMHEQHIRPTPDQREHAEAAAKNPDFAAANNHGRPAIAATARPNDFTHNVVAAREAGPANPEAEEHNIQVKHNPEMAHGASLPQAHPVQPQAMHSNAQAPHPAAQPQHQPQAQPVHEGGAQPVRENAARPQNPAVIPTVHPNEARPAAQAHPQQPHPQAPHPQGERPAQEHPAPEHGPEEHPQEEHHE